MRAAKYCSLCLAIIGFTLPITTFGMSYWINITVDNLSSDRPVFRFVKPVLANPKWTKKSIMLNSFSVQVKRSGAWDFKHPLWEFSLAPGADLKIKEIRYGIVPEGFTETTFDRWETCDRAGGGVGRPAPSAVGDSATLQ